MSGPVIIQKNARESYRLAWDEYQGHRFVDARIYYRDSDGELKPTRKGISIKPDALPEIIAALQTLSGEVQP